MIRDEIVAQSDLVEAVTEALKRKGVYGNIKAQLRAKVFHALEDKTVDVPEKPRDVFLASELIRDFLMSFDLQNTTSVFCEEMGQPPEMSVDRELIGGELGLNTKGSSSSVPLLMQLIQHLVKEKEERICRMHETNTGRAIDGPRTTAGAVVAVSAGVGGTSTSLEVETGVTLTPDASLH